MKNGKDITKVLKNRMLELVIVLMIIIFTAIRPDFGGFSNWLNIIRNISLYGLVALGMCVLFAAGGIDLSVGATAGLASVIVPMMTEAFFNAGMSKTAGCIAGIFVALLVGLFIGAFIALFSTVFKMPPFIVTLSLSYATQGVAGMLTGGFSKIVVPDWYNALASYYLFGTIPMCAVFFALMCVVFFVFMNMTETGRTMYAVGGNKEAARLSGINVNKYIFLSFIIVQEMAIIAGIMLSSQMKAGAYNYGVDWGMIAISSVLIGGSGLEGGTGTIWGTIMGLIFTGMILNFMTLLNLSQFTQLFVRGILILIAVMINVSDMGVVFKRLKRKA